jgi:glycosyltransferase 2 family protein
VGTAVLALLVLLFARQIHTWAQFDWSQFVAQWAADKAHKTAYALAGAALIYVGLVLRACRWREFLAHSRATTVGKLLGPTVIGFAALALFGRPGEFLRPYLIARKEQLPFSSQLAVWTVERLFDMSSFGLICGLGLALGGSGLASLPYFHQFERGGYIILAGIAVLALAAFVIAKRGTAIAARFEAGSSRFARFVGKQLRGLAVGFDTIPSAAAFARIALASVVMWSAIAGAYWFSVHAFPAPLADFSPAEVLLLMAFSMVGSLAQLPGGSTSQLVVITALVNVFRVRPELALSCGIMIWLVTYISPVPAGLGVARHEHLSLRRLEHDAEEEAAAV